MGIRLAELTDGSWGLLPDGTRTGDVIYVLSGLSVPCVTRFGADGLAKHISARNSWYIPSRLRKDGCFVFLRRAISVMVPCRRRLVIEFAWLLVARCLSF